MKINMPSEQNFTTEPQSVLVIGASGRTGLECLRALNKSSNVNVHAFCRDKSKLENEACSSIVTGNARSADDLERALLKTKADTVIVSVGNGDSVKKSDIRTASAQALASLMKEPAFKNLRVLIVSSAGAGSSKIIVGMGIGMLISYHLKYILKDHTGQELAFSSPDIKRRTCIVRASSLVDNKATGNLVTYGDEVKGPSIETDRADLAAWVAEKVCGSVEDFGGRTFNVTTGKM